MTVVGDLALAIRPAGDRAILLDLPSDAVLAVAAALERRPLPGQVDLVPAERTLLVIGEPGSAPALRAALAAVPVASGGRPEGRDVEIEVVYDGEDLAEAAAALGLTADGVVAYHTAEPWIAVFTGFAPGFAYLTREDALPVPRRATSRTTVPPGSVGLAGAYSGVYPRSSPGGWQLIGRTSAAMWDPSRAAPALVRPGDRVAFRSVERLSAPEPPSAPRSVPPAPPFLAVVSPGVLMLVEDLGRPAAAGSGVASSGALDRRSFRAANRAVGNPVSAAGLEVVAGGAELVAAGRVLVAIGGAETEAVTGSEERGWRSLAAGEPRLLDDGERLVLGGVRSGLRCYVAVAGGVEVEPVLGSRSTDLLSGLGPAPVRAGELLPIGRARGDAARPEPAALAVPSQAPLRVHPGPRDDWFAPDALDILCAEPWTVTPASSRVGLRLASERIVPRERADELPSEGMIPGAIQVPPSGEPVLFLRDAPVTGGYPVIGVVDSVDLDRAAQLAPGDLVRFASIGLSSRGAASTR